MTTCVEYLDVRGKSRFGAWFDKLNPTTAARITRAVRNMEYGNFSNAKPIGDGVSEYRIDAGPGYRLYYARDGEKVVLLLGGGTKRGQQKDIDRAKRDWADYKSRRQQE
ncbi:MAG: type II toxin-antitoxin system RelE/ParE family toxin [Sulfitobacter sp.]